MSYIPINQSVKSVADATAVQQLTGMQDGDKIAVANCGVYCYDATYANVIADNETVITPGSGVGAWILQSPSLDMVWGAMLPELSARDMDLARLTDAYNLLAAKHNDLAARFNAHTHAYAYISSGSGTTSANNQNAAAVDATANLTYTTEL